MVGPPSFSNWDVFVILLALASTVLLLVAVPVTIGALVSWLVRHHFPSNRFVRACVFVVVAIPVAWIVGLAVSSVFNKPSESGRGMFSLPVVDESRCTEAPPAAATEIASNLAVGSSNTVAWYEVKLEEAELVGPWVMVATSPEYEPSGYWIGVNSIGAHSYRTLGEEPSSWMPLNSFEGLVLFFTRDPVGDSGFLAIGDEPNDYRTRMFGLPSGNQFATSDRDSTATLAYCLTGTGPFSLDFQEGWLSGQPWYDFSRRIEEPLWYICSNPPVYDKRCPNHIKDQ
jgi:hypothetical protein